MERRLSLVSAFTPPDGMVGVAALMTALNAEAPVLRSIFTAFTDETDAQRGMRGAATALLALDWRADRSTLRTVPGLVVAEPVPTAWSAGSMLHAKLALLGYAADAEAPIGWLRLIVSTGNWTAASMNQQIDMLWMCDINLADTGDRRSNADVKAASLFFRELLYPADGEVRLFQILPAAAPRVAELLARAGALPAGRSISFIHSLHKPLLPQIAKRFKPGKEPWNWLCAGSGFFELPTESDPVVFARIDKELGRHLTASASRRIILNPTRAGALAGADLQGWTVCKPQPHDGRDCLHAKFIAAGRRHGGGHRDIAVYLGSGNLSKAGLLSAFHERKSQTRIEAGVVFTVGKCGVEELKALLPDGDPLDPQELATLEAGDLKAGSPEIRLPPILFARAIPAVGDTKAARLFLQKPQPEVAAELRLRDEVVQVPLGLDSIEAPGFAEAYLDVRVPGDKSWASVPVIGADGCFARMRPMPSDFEDALNALRAFPAIPEPAVADPNDPDPSDDEADVATDGNMRPEGVRDGKASGYPARDAMRVVEAIARMLPTDAAAAQPDDSPDRFQALRRTIERTLTDGLRAADKSRFAALGVNFLFPLKEMPGMPPGPDWDCLIDRIAEDWGLMDLPALSVAGPAVRRKEKA